MKMYYTLVYYKDKTTNFKLTDEMFDLQQPNSKVYPDELECHVCEKKLKKKNKAICDFCGHLSCKKHCYKMRIFANQKIKDSNKNLSLS